MRILMVTQSYAPFFEFGGPPVKVRALAEGLARCGHEVTVLTADWGLQKRSFSSANEPPAQPDPFGRAHTVNGVTAVYLPNWLHFRAASWNPTLGRYLRTQLQNFNIAHIFGLYDLLGSGVGAECHKRGIPYLVEPIGMFVPIVRNLFLKGIYHRLWGRRLLAHATAIIATAEQERAELTAGGLPKDKILLRRNGVEAPTVLPERGLFRRSLNIPLDHKLILFLGRLSQKKSPDLLLKAFAHLAGTNSAGSAVAQLAFVGPDEAGMKSRLQRMASGFALSDRVHFSPALTGDAKWSAYRDADIFVLPSQNENFGNTAAESVAAGTPVIVTDQCGIAPLLKDVSGLVVRHDEQDLTHALSHLLEDNQLYSKLRSGCAAAMATLGWEEPIEEMNQIYTGLARLRLT
jgi:glycosyltransferase involved in cell wall biosynthesis